MTDHQSLIMFILSGGVLATGLGDYITTAIGLGKGMVEVNPINKFLFAKIGQAGTAFIEIAAALFTPIIMAQYAGFKYGAAYAAALIALEGTMTIRNAKLLKMI